MTKLAVAQKIVKTISGDKTKAQTYSGSVSWATRSKRPRRKTI